MSRTMRFLPLALLLLMLAGLLWRIANPGDTAVRSQMVGKPVPELSLPGAFDEKPITSASFADGKPRVLNFFASWCVPCIAEAPLLLELKRQGAVVDGIAVRDRPENIARFLNQHGDPFARVGLDPQSAVQLAFGSAGVPETFVVDGKGIIRFQHIGVIERGDLPKILRALEEAR